MTDIVGRLREYQDSWADAIKRLDSGEFDNGIMTSIRLEQHATWKEAADEIIRLRARVAELERAIDEEMVVTHLGVFNPGDDPVKAIKTLMNWAQGVGEYFERDKLRAAIKEIEK